MNNDPLDQPRGWAFLNVLIKYGALLSAAAYLIGYCVEEGYTTSLGLPQSEVVVSIGRLIPRGIIGLFDILFPASPKLA